MHFVTPMALCIVTSQAHAQQDDAPKVSVGVVSAERKTDF